MIASTILAHVVVFIGLLTLCFVSFYYVRYTYLKNNPKTNSAPIINSYDSSQLKALISSPQANLSNAGKEEEKGSIRFKPYMAVAFIPLAITLTAIPTVYKNRHLFLPKIQLTAQEQQHLPIIRHQLRPVNNYRSKPTNPNQLSRPIVIVGNNQFFESWKSNLGNQSEIISCNAYLALTCDTRKIRKIYIIDMHGRKWEQILLLLKEGHNVIAYGADDNFDTRVASRLGLRSSNSESSKSNYISLVSDKELTLGITSSPTLFVGSTATTLTIKSDNPQAISMLPDGRPGGFSAPRLHSKSLNGSRFIWMDFLPKINTGNNANDSEIHQQLIANLVRYINDQQYQHIATWPNSKSTAAFLAIEASGHSHNLDNFIDRYKTAKTPLTTFLSNKYAFENRDYSNRLSKLGEIGCMAHNEDLLTRYSSSDQTKKMAHCRKVINAITGQTVTGFKPPLESFNQSTLNSILNSNLRYIFASQSTYSNLPEISESQTGAKLVRIPRIVSDGFLLWQNLELPDAAVLDRLTDEFDWTKLSNGLFGFTFNIDQLKNDERTNVIIALSEVLSQNDVYLSTLSDISEWWLLRQALVSQPDVVDAKRRKQIKRYNPSVLYVDAQGKLKRKPFAL